MSQKQSSRGFFEDFEKVYKSEMEGSESKEEGRKSMERIASFYNLSGLQVVLLSGYLHKGTDSEPSDSISFDVLFGRQGNDEEVGNALRGLFTRGFLSFKKADTWPVDPCISGIYVSQTTRESFKDEKPVDELCPVDPMNFLLNTSPVSTLSFFWNLRMSESLTPRFRKLFKTLSIPMFPDITAVAFWAVCSQMAAHFSKPMLLEDNILDKCYADYHKADIETCLVNLTRAGIIETISSEDSGNEGKARTGYILSPKVARMVFHGEDHIVRYDCITEFASITRHGDIQHKELFFSEKSQQEVDNLKTMLSRKGYAKACRILRKQKRNPSIQSLFFGPPGTGKTEVIRQIARETRRDIISFDAARLNNAAWGASEKCYRGLFRAYRYITEICENPPILLMNEADQMLCRRMSRIDSSLDKSENTITDILLEEIERMNGILLATTNLADNIDPAFDRRFLFKTEMKEPDAQARFKIWKSLMNGLKDEESRILADEYTISGAQISNVVAKRELAEIYYTGERGLEFIKDLCEKEISSGKGNAVKRIKIGY